MIDYETFARIKVLHEEKGLACSQIAKELGLDPRTVARKLGEKRFSARKESQRTSRLDPYKEEIVRMLETHPYTATQICQRIRENGFDGGYTIVKDYVRKVRPNRTPAFLTLAFAPGECAQVDWGSYGFVNVGSTRRRLSFFVMTLCYSRMSYVEFTVSQTMEHFLACHQNAFAFFGGTPEKVMVDNLKSAVLKRPLGQSPVLNPKYLDFANHYGFAIAPCNVAKGNEKGRVENAVGYVKKNFLAGLEMPDFSVLNPAARQWMDATANIRIHGATKQKPEEMFQLEGQSLKPLPENLFDIAAVSEVRASSQFRITLDSNRYSVPAQYAGMRLTLKACPDRLCLYSEGKLVARHTRSYDRNRDFEDPDHPKVLLERRKKAKDQKIVTAFLDLSPMADRYYSKLEERRMNALQHVRKIVALSEIYGAEQVGRTMEDALEFEAYSCEYIANLLEQRSRSLPEAGALHLARNADMLDLSLEQPDLGIYRTTTKNK